MNLIVGLGNPGSGYTLNRHNAGFMALTRLAEKKLFNTPGRFKSSQAVKGSLKGHPVVLAWPQTYMNLSGEAVLELASFYKIKCEDILVVHDEMDLAPGRIKLTLGGSAAGHNGLASIQAHLKQDFCRLKIGIGRPPKDVFPPGQSQGHADYVLGNFHNLEWPLVEESLERAIEAAEIWLHQGLTQAQNLINRRQRENKIKPEVQAKAPAKAPAENPAKAPTENQP